MIDENQPAVLEMEMFDFHGKTEIFAFACHIGPQRF